MKLAASAAVIARHYCEDVCSGKIPACETVRRACALHLSDLANQKKKSFKYYFDEDAAQLVVDFFGLLTHSKGEWAGQTFELAPWQTFIVACIFGWKRKANDARRYKSAYIEVPRKNGKSTLLAGIGLYMLTADGEPGAEVYTLATKRAQAKIIFDEMEKMVIKSPALNKRIDRVVNNMSVRSTFSKCEPLGRDKDGLDGLNPHCAIIDELHAHKTSELWDVMDSAVGARRQPLVITITTAGFNQEGICFEVHKYVERILDPNDPAEDDEFFGIIYGLDGENKEEGRKADDWQEEDSWIKANPNWGVSVNPEDMRRMANKAASITSQQNNFLVKRLNIWTQQADRWINLVTWDDNAGSFKSEDLLNKPCYSGLDLSSTSDLTSLVHYFPHNGAVLCRFWIPKDNAIERSKRDRVPYEAWEIDGYITLTEGNSIDYAFIEQQILADCKAFDVRKIGVDPYNARQTITNLTERHGLTNIVEFRQGYISMNEPSKNLEVLLAKRLLKHGGHPILRWNANNVVIRTDAAGNIKPDKEKSREKIDGIVSLIMAEGLAMVDTGPKVSKYEEKELRVFGARG